MFAVFKTGGKQYRVAAEDVLKVDKIKGEPGEIVEFGEVLVVGGESVTLGAPTVAGATVAAEVLDQGRGGEDHRLQKAPAEEFAPQARSSAGIHAAADHGNPDRRQEAEHDGAAAAEAGVGSEARGGRGRSCRSRGGHRKAVEAAPAKAKGRAKSGAAKAKKPAAMRQKRRQATKKK